MKTEQEFNARQIAENMVHAQLTSPSGRFPKTAPYDAGAVWSIQIRGWTVFESTDEVTVNAIAADIRAQMSECFYSIYCRGGEDETNAWLGSMAERKMKATEAIADAQTVLAYKAMTGSTADPGTPGDRVRARFAQKDAK